MTDLTFQERRDLQRIDELIGPEICKLLGQVDARNHAHYTDGMKALALAPNLEIYQALMRGEQVPTALLNQDALIRYGTRKAER